MVGSCPCMVMSEQCKGGVPCKVKSVQTGAVWWSLYGWMAVWWGV